MQSVSVGKVSFELDDEGSGDPVLLLHGFPTTRLLWRDVVPHLTAAGFRTLAPDLVGYGGSRAPPGTPVDMASQATWLLALLDRLGIDKAFVVAHDVGSAAAQILVARAPERVRALVVADGVYAGEWAMEAVAPIRDWDPAQAGRLYKLLVRRVRSSGGQARAPEERVREMLAAYEGEEGGARLIQAAQNLDPRQTESILGELRARRVPALVVWGDNDLYLPVDSVARPLADLLGARLVLLAGGHFLPLDSPAELASTLLQYLRRGA